MLPSPRLLLLAPILLVFGQPALAWQTEVARGAANVARPGRGLAVDEAGNIVAFGRGYEHMNEARQLVRFQGGTGRVLWRMKPSFYPEDLVHDPDGNLLVATSGRDTPDLFKLDASSGATLWSETLDFDGGIGAIASDANGDVIVAGRAVRLPGVDPVHGPPLVAVVRKHDGVTGAVLWTFYSGPGDVDAGQAYTVTVDAAGDVLAGGFLPGSVAVWKIDGATGLEIWTYQAPQATSRAHANDLAVDAAGDVVVAAANSSQFAAIKLAGPTGAEIWRSEIPGSAVDADSRALSVALDAAGDVFAGGWIDNLGSERDFAVVKFSGSDGSERWRQLIQGNAAPDNYDRAYELAVDAAGDVVAVGALDQLSPLTGTQGLLVKLSGVDGNELWQRAIWGRGTRPWGIGSSVAVDGDGAIVALAFTSTRPKAPGFETLSILKLSADGEDILPGRLRVRERSGGVLLRFVGSGAGYGAGVGHPIGGASVELLNPTTGESASVSIPSGDEWRTRGDPARGFRYRGEGPCRTLAFSANSRLTASCEIPGFSLDELAQGSLVVRVTFGSPGSERAYCAQLSGDAVRRDLPGTFMARAALAPSRCASP